MHVGGDQATLFDELGEREFALRPPLPVVVGEVAGGADPVVPGGQREELLARLVLRQCRHGKDVRRQHALREVVDAREVASAAGRR